MTNAEASNGAKDDAAALRSLSPTYVAEEHADYVKILKGQLTKTGNDAPLNIALTGHYGSGKSSVLLETKRELETSLKVINLSLPSLGIGDGRIPEDGNRALEITNLIQKEIVKQLLYRRKPSDMPASRFTRLDTFHMKRALPVAVGFGVGATGLAVLATVPDKVRSAIPAEAWAWVNNNLWWELATPIQWSTLLLVFALTAMAAIWAQRLLQQRIRVTELTAGPTKVTLSDTSSSYFDEYLDEIVYFFQTSQTSVVIFEDLDRFKDPHIFETLRELNLLLNNAEQTGATPIRFVYAIRDSIFEQLDVDTIGKDNESGSSKDEPSEDASWSTQSADSGHQKRRLTSTNRTKFFDLVVPVVPFISHRTSRDLIRRELTAVSAAQRPTNAAIDIVGAHLTDMRLIKNICNEYEVFRRRILSAGGLEALTADRLFASIVYKNLYLLDYENIRDGTSSLDKLYVAYRDWVKQQIASARTSERRARTRLRKIDVIGPRSEKLGARLQAVLIARHVSNLRTSTTQLFVSGTPYAWSDITTPAFWRAYLQDRGALEVRTQPGVRGDVLAFDKVQTLMGSGLSTDDWTEEDEAEANDEIAAAEADQRTIQHATMADALLGTERKFSYNKRNCSFAEVAEELFRGKPLVLELIRAGLIDENFTLYVTQFPGQAISASAMNFIIKAVQPDVMDIEYHFGVGEQVNAGDIESVLEAEEGRLLGGQSVYNIELFDYLLAKDSDKLVGPIARLASVAHEDLSFIEAYLASGASPEKFVKALSASWLGIFNYLIDPSSDAPNVLLLDAAVSGVDPGIKYVLPPEHRTVLRRILPQLSTLKLEQPKGQSKAIAQTLDHWRILISRLDDVAEPLRSELVKLDCYSITLANLSTILGGRGNMPLDRIKHARETDVYIYVLENLDDYLLSLAQAGNIPTISTSEEFVDIMSDVAKVDVDVMEDVARLASADCMLTDLTDFDAGLWPAFAGAHRLTLTARNVAAYVAKHDVDSDLANWLRTAGAIILDPADSTPLPPLALKLLNAGGLGDSAALQVIDGLGLAPGSIAAGDLDRNAHTMLPDLVEKGIVSDDADAYASLEGAEWSVKERLILVSKEFPEYMDSLELSSGDLLRIVTRPVPELIKDQILHEIDTVGANLGPKGAVALAIRAVEGRGRTPTPEGVVALAKKGGSGAVRPILRLLGERARTIELELLKEALNALGEPYSQLTKPGRDRPKVDVAEGLEDILSRLKAANIVSKFELNSRKRVFEVSKRHS